MRSLQKQFPTASGEEDIIRVTAEPVQSTDTWFTFTCHLLPAVLHQKPNIRDAVRRVCEHRERGARDAVARYHSAERDGSRGFSDWRAGVQGSQLEESDVVDQEDCKDMAAPGKSELVEPTGRQETDEGRAHRGLANCRYYFTKVKS